MAQLAPGPKGFPFIGMIPHFMRDLFGYLQTIKSYGDVVRVPLGLMEFTYIIHPDHAETILLKERKNFDKGETLELLRLFLGNGLVSSDGELWRRQRLRMAPSFQPKHLDQLLPAMAETASAYFAQLGEGGVRRVDEDMMGLTLELALRLLFGTTASEGVKTIGDAFEDISMYFASSRLLFKIPLWVPTPSNQRFKRSYKQLESVISRIIEERRAADTAGDDLLAALLEGVDDEGIGMDDAQLRDELRTLMFAGHETTALGLTYAAWLLAGDEALQNELSARVREVCDGRPVEGDDYAALGFVEAAFKEAMRLYPPAPIILRAPLEDITLGGYHIPARTNLVLAIMLIQRDERFYEDPERFDPSRWTPAFEKSLPRFAYFPFGGGPRVCIGARMAMMEGTLLLAELLRRFKLQRLDDKPLEVLPSITMRPKHPVRLRLLPHK